MKIQLKSKLTLFGKYQCCTLNNQATGIDWIRWKIVRILCDEKNSKELEPCQGEQKQNFTSSQQDGVQTKVFPHEN